jgi:hypothetical protein
MAQPNTRTSFVVRRLLLRRRRRRRRRRRTDKGPARRLCLKFPRRNASSSPRPPPRCYLTFGAANVDRTPIERFRYNLTLALLRLENGACMRPGGATAIFVGLGGSSRQAGRLAGWLTTIAGGRQSYRWLGFVIRVAPVGCGGGGGFVCRCSFVYQAGANNVVRACALVVLGSPLPSCRLASLVGIIILISLVGSSVPGRYIVSTRAYHAAWSSWRRLARNWGRAHRMILCSPRCAFATDDVPGSGDQSPGWHCTPAAAAAALNTTRN